MNDIFDLPESIGLLAARARADCLPFFDRIDAATEINQQKTLKAFIDCRVAEADMTASTGYGYGDRGREKLDEVVARTFGAPDALIRHSFASGTHTLTVALFGLLRPGDVMLSVTGTPYDTIRPVIGVGGRTGIGSLADFGVTYKEVALTPGGEVDLDALSEALGREKIKLVYIQRSRGYTLRPSLGVGDIARVCELVHNVSDALVFVDNCYGEFVETTEPVTHGADVIAGSLIKNPGGGIAKCGGYIAGREDLIELISYRMTAPGVGREIGATLGNTRDMMMGFFNAPHVTGEALKTAVFAARCFELMGFETSPRYDEPRRDIIQSIKLGSDKNLIAFCRGLQSGSPVDSFVAPEPWDMPGYDSKVIMAAGAFTNGSSIELSADAPLRPPYAVWLQGALNHHSAKIGILKAAAAVARAAGGDIS